MSSPFEVSPAADLSDPGEPQRGVVAILALAVLTAAALVFGGLSYRHWQDRHDTVEDRADVKAAAAEAIPAFSQFDYKHLNDDIKRAKQVLTPCFGAQYANTLEQAVPLATQAMAVVTDTAVEGVQVLDLKGSLAHVQAFFDQKAEFGDGRPTKVDPYRVLMDLVKIHGAWKVNYLDIDDEGASPARQCKDDGVTAIHS